MLICSKSTRRYFPDQKEFRIVTGPADSNILKERSRYDTVIAVGGGAVIDTAKILSKKTICFPTTAAGAVYTSHAVYWDGTDKKSIEGGPAQEIHIVKKFIDDLPEIYKEYTTYDVLSHCLDVMWSNKKTAKSMFYVRHALETLKNCSTVELVAAGNLAGKAIEICSTTILHSLSYPLTGFYGIPHGKALGFLLPIVCDYMEFDLSEFIKYPKVKLNNIDFDFIIREGLQYDKINSVSKIDFDKIKTMMKNAN